MSLLRFQCFQCHQKKPSVEELCGEQEPITKNNQLITMQQSQMEYKDCGKHISEYSVSVLPRGDELSHTTYIPVKYKNAKPQRGMCKKLTDEEKTAEAQAMLEKQEAKAMKLNFDVEPQE